MGSGRHSSKRKSSSSSARKKRKRYKDRTKKKSKSDRHKSKKPYLRDRSVSYSDNDSASDSSESYSSSYDDKRSKRRGRHQARRDLKGRKRRAKRNDSEEDTRKHKRSKRIRDTDERKKRHEKKQRRKPSVSSLSSRSRSCSTCGSSDSRDQEFERTELRSEKTEKKDQGMNRGGSDSRYRSRSFCSFSSHSDSGGRQSEEGVIDVSSLKRLRSVIMVTKKREDTEGMASDRDALKDEIVYDHDDYPSSRSNDSNDGVCKRESSHHSKSGKPISLENQSEGAVASDVKITKIVGSGELDTEQQDGNFYGIREGQVNDIFKENRDEVSTINDGSSGENLEAISWEKALEAVASDVRTTKFLEIGKLHAQQHDVNLSNAGGVQVTHPLEENKEAVSSADNGSNGDDLEAVLRQKALENLRKFRGEIQANAKIPSGKRGNHDGEVKNLSAQKIDLGQDKCEKRGLGLTDATSKVDKTSVSAVRRDTTPYTPKSRNDLVQSSIPKTATVQHEPEKEVCLQLVSATSKVDQVSKSEVVRDLTSTMPNFGKDLDAKYRVNASGAVKLDGILPPTRKQLIHSSSKKLVPYSDPSEKGNATFGATSDKSNLSTMALKKESLETNKNLKQMPTSREPSLQRMSTPLETGQCSASKGSSQSHDGKIVPDGSERFASCELSTGKCGSAGQSSSDKPNEVDKQNEVDEGSQFQQKTMSVMRGGELVHVSYKVYIPKKNPALARRQLNR